MECGHAFCDDCWRQHLTIQVTDGNAKRLPCMGVKCGVICDETKVSSPSINWSASYTVSVFPARTPLPIAILAVLHLLRGRGVSPSPQHGPRTCHDSTLTACSKLAVLDTRSAQALRCGASWRATSSCWRSIARRCWSRTWTTTRRRSGAPPPRTAATPSRCIRSHHVWAQPLEFSCVPCARANSARQRYFPCTPQH